MKTGIRRSSWIVTVPVAAAAVAYITLSFLPNRHAISEARNQIKEKQDYIVQAGSLDNALRIAEEELEKIRACTTAWQRQAPVEGELSALYGQIHELAKATGTAVTRFDPEPVVRYERISRIPVGMACVGSFAEICGFLEGLEGLPLEIWVDELRLGRVIQGGQVGQEGQSVSCELTLAVFVNNSENSDYVEDSE